MSLNSNLTSLGIYVVDIDFTFSNSAQSGVKDYRGLTGNAVSESNILGCSVIASSVLPVVPSLNAAKTGISLFYAPNTALSTTITVPCIFFYNK